MIIVDVTSISGLIFFSSLIFIIPAFYYYLCLWCWDYKERGRKLIRDKEVNPAVLSFSNFFNVAASIMSLAATKEIEKEETAGMRS